MQDLLDKINTIYKDIVGNSYLYKSYLYFLYMFAWIVFNICLLLIPSLRLMLFKSTTFNYLNIIIVDLIITLCFKSMSVFIFSWSFYFVNLIALVVTMMALPFFGVIRVITTILISIILWKEGYKIYKTSSFYDDDYEDDDN